MDHFNVLFHVKLGNILITQMTIIFKVKGQLISECPLDVLDFPKKQKNKKSQISALESKKWRNQQNKATF